jgi:hypothetical protein
VPIPWLLDCFRTALAVKGQLRRAYRRALDCCGLVLNKDLTAKREWRRLKREDAGFGARQKSSCKSCFSSGPLFESESGSFLESTEGPRSRFPEIVENIENAEQRKESLERGERACKASVNSV